VLVTFYTATDREVQVRTMAASAGVRGVLPKPSEPGTGSSFSPRLPPGGDHVAV
jgi:hypothetical protein